MCYLAVLTGSQNSCQLNMRRLSIVCNNVYAISTILLRYYIYVFIFYIFIFIIVCFVSALPDPTCNSEKSANGGNKQIFKYSNIHFGKHEKSHLT